MKTYKVYHNPRCSKSRLALTYIEDKGDQAEVIEYLKDIPGKKELKELIKMLGIPAEELLRKGEQDYKDHFKGKKLTEDEWIDAMIKYPKLIERPIIVLNNKAVIGRPAERILELN